MNDSEETDVFSNTSEQFLADDAERRTGFSEEEDPPTLLSPLSVNARNEKRQRSARIRIFFPESENLCFFTADIQTAFQNDSKKKRIN